MFPLGTILTGVLDNGLHFTGPFLSLDTVPVFYDGFHVANCLLQIGSIWVIPSRILGEVDACYLGM